MLNVVLDIFYQPNTEGYETRKVDESWTNENNSDIFLNVYCDNETTTVELHHTETSEFFSMTFKSDDSCIDFFISRLREVLQSVRTYTLRIENKQVENKEHTVKLFTDGNLIKELDVNPMHVVFGIRTLYYEE